MDKLAAWHLTSLIQYLFHGYFLQLSTVLIVHNSSAVDQLHFEYLQALQRALVDGRHELGGGSGSDDSDGSHRGKSEKSAFRTPALQWIDVAHLDDSELEAQMLTAVDIANVEGFITILSNTSRFLNARYYASRYSTLRLKDKFYLFLCGADESPQDLLTSELLQFYPHHLMVTPERRQIKEKPATNTTTAENQGSPSQRTKRHRKTYFWPPEAGKNVRKTGRTATTISTVTAACPSLPASSSLSSSSHQSSKLTLSQELFHRTNLSRVAANAAPQPSHEQSLLRLLLPRTGGSKAKSSRPVSLRDINFELWTQKYTGAAGNLDPVLLNEFLPNETFLHRNIELYPNKLLNMQGRAIYLGSLTYIPYTITNYVPAGAGNVDPINPNDPNRTVSFIGTEAELIITFCQRHNCHLRVRPYGADNWGVILANGTATGMLGDLYLQRVEFAIGCVYNWYNDATETSVTIARSAVTLLGPAPELFPAWRTNILPFTNEVWALTLVTLLLCVFVLHSIKIISRNFERSDKELLRLKLIEETFLEIYAIFLEQTYAFTVTKHPAVRVFLAILFGAALTLENTYSGQLKSILAVPFYSDPIDTTEKWSRTDWKWAAPSIIWAETIAQSDLTKEQILTKKFEVKDYDFLYNASFRMDYGLGIERLNSGTFSLGHYITLAALNTKIIPKDDLYFDWTRAVSIRGWPLMPLLDAHIRTFMETGLFFHLERQIVQHQLDRRILESVHNLASGHTPKLPPQKLSVASISAALFALFMGHLLAFSVFLIEVFAHNISATFTKVFRRT